MKSKLLHFNFWQILTHIYLMILKKVLEALEQGLKVK
ncbi:hypothetical protein AB205_0195930 [Aquarana catesbeiana]|uniref:Uncharacterized protein n=1 Tax=Aquarana catesbeiana TaxID=8400 RepID=A0A2G9PNG5_AQUCT|nr:hypothetical protein AB205_0195930 [Aquarana catesbeiana]